MRRKDFEVSDLAKAYNFLDQMQDGSLATLTKDRTPSVRAMNFVRIENDLYFHGAKMGEKMEGLAVNASFFAYKALSLIPSYWSDEKNACPATALFQSVVVKGQFDLVENLELKAKTLQSLMEKLQPEGNYLPFANHFDFYEKSLKQVSVFVLQQKETSYKVKLGQNWNAEKRQKIYDHLVQRGAAIDHETLRRMDEFGLLK